MTSTTLPAVSSPATATDALPLWLNPAYSKHIVKGNFMTLSARPKTVEQGEWVAHQAVENFRNLWNFVRVVHEKEEDGTSICNSHTCPKMSAGLHRSYTWLNKNQEPVELPAHEYMTLMQRWVSGKTDDVSIFPTDASGVAYHVNPDLFADAGVTARDEGGNRVIVQGNGAGEWLGSRSGFPQQFAPTAQLIFRQIFRVYAHLYWSHYTEPFYHLNLEKQLNSCFSHFLLTAIALDMLTKEEVQPMQRLIELWAGDGTFPRESKAFTFASGN